MTVPLSESSEKTVVSRLSGHHESRTTQLIKSPRQEKRRRCDYLPKRSAAQFRVLAFPPGIPPIAQPTLAPHHIVCHPLAVAIRHPSSRRSISILTPILDLRPGPEPAQPRNAVIARYCKIRLSRAWKPSTGHGTLE